MRPDRDTLSIESTLQGEDVRMRIAEGAEAHIMSILTDMYENRILAQCREYSTNAWDSHIEAGQTRPIEVTTPSALRPLLSIRDFGIGLDADGIRRIYSQYGASTKRDTDEQTGMLGIGCKAALTYSDQFTVVGVKDGIKTIVSVSRDEDGAATMKILTQDPTTDKPGVDVQIPTKRGDITQFQTEAEWFFKFWQPGTILLNGKDPAGLEGYKLTDTLTVVDGEEHDYLVMGNVPYPTDLGIYERSYRNSSHVVAEVGIGALTFTPSREGLQDTGRTQKCIARVKQEFNTAAKLAVQRDVDAAPNKAEALDAYMDAVSALPSSATPSVASIRYKGEGLPVFPAVNTHRTIANSGSKYSQGSYVPELTQIGKGIWVTEYENASWNKTQREKLIAFLETQHPSLDDVPRRPLFLLPEKEVPQAEWVPEQNVIAWPTVRKWQPPLKPGDPVPTYKRTGIYYGYRPAATYVTDIGAADLPTDKVIYWKECRKYAGSRAHKELIGAKDTDDFFFIVLPANRVKKFVKDFPKAMEAEAFMKSKAVTRRKSLPAGVAEATHFEDPGYDFDELDPALVNDPALKKVIAIAKTRTKHRNLIEKLRRERLRYDLSPLPGGPPPEAKVVYDRYPLLKAVAAGYGRAPKADLYIYINAAYAARQ